MAAIETAIEKLREVYARRNFLNRDKETNGTLFFVCQALDLPITNRFFFPIEVGKKKKRIKPLGSFFNVPIMLSAAKTHLNASEYQAIEKLVIDFYKVDRAALPESQHLQVIAGNAPKILQDATQFKWAHLPGFQDRATYESTRRKKVKPATEVGVGKVKKAAGKKAKAKLPQVLQIEGGKIVKIGKGAKVQELDIAQANRMRRELHKNPNCVVFFDAQHGVNYEFIKAQEGEATNKWFPQATGKVMVSTTKKIKLAAE